jgi:N-acetylneuraminic acid mutarotase
VITKGLLVEKSATLSWRCILGIEIRATNMRAWCQPGTMRVIGSGAMLLVGLIAGCSTAASSIGDAGSPNAPEDAGGEAAVVPPGPPDGGSSDEASTNATDANGTDAPRDVAADGEDAAPAQKNLFLFGGVAVTTSTYYANDTWRFDGTKTWTQVGVAAPSAREGHSMATLGNKIVLFGGCGGRTSTSECTSLLGDTWTFDGSTWTSVPVNGVSPAARAGHSMASLNGSVVLFGGYDGTKEFDDTWTFDGSSWSLVVTRGATPPARSGSPLATLGGKLVLFGGWDGTSDLDDTWTFDGQTWTQVVIHGTTPPARRLHAMAGADGIAVLFGGLHDFLVARGDAWSFDGTSWTALPIGPDPRGGSAMAFVAGKLILFGGSDRSFIYDDTWSFNGNTWSKLPNDSHPVERDGHALATLP